MKRREPGINIELTPFKIGVAVVVGILLLVFLGRVVSKAIPPLLDSKWSKPVQLAHSDQAWGTGLSLYRWNGAAVGMRDGGVFYLQGTNGDWTELVISEFDGYRPVAIDAHGPTAIFCDLKYSENKVGSVTTLLRAEMTGKGIPKAITGIPVKAQLEQYFKDLSAPARASPETSMFFAGGLVRGTKVYLNCDSRNMRFIPVKANRGPSQYAEQSGATESCLFSSSDSGESWQASAFASGVDAGQASLLATSSRVFSLWTESPSSLWASSRVGMDASESQSNLLVSTLKGGFLTEAGGDTLHVCWMDKRLKEGIGFFIYGDWDIGRKNNQVFYAHHRDKDSTWRKEHRLSGSLSYCESPAMSVEGSKIVVAWHHYVKPYNRAAIYYTVSKDNGQSWSRPRRVDNSETATAESPRVLLDNGIIHLFYDRGDRSLKRWDLMHQRREFPN